MSEDINSEDEKQEAPWEIPRGTGVDISNLTKRKIDEISKRKNLNVVIDGDSMAMGKGGKLRANINEVVIKGKLNKTPMKQ